MTPIVVRRFGPARPWTNPGSIVGIEVELEARSPAGQGAAVVTVELLDVDRVVARRRRRTRLGEGPASFGLRMWLPPTKRHGYGLRLVVEAAGRRIVATSAVEAIEGWWESPRHAALTRFRTTDGVVAAVRALRDWHVNVVQAYDWMYRHYRYEPPSGATFRDALGRVVSHDAVRAAVRAGRESGIATLAYGSVYGAEPEYVAAHPDERVFDDAGEPLSLGGTFHINDLRPGGPWRRRLLHEYARACRQFGFDGVHMDTYGPPHEAVTADGQRIRFAELYPGLIHEAAATVARTGRGRRVLFNCVEGFPLESVAPAPIAALYLELWPPDDRYADILRWIERARAVANGRAIVIAAYLSAFRDAGVHPRARARAVEAAVLLTTMIAASGAYHHVIAEGDRMLVEGYYPAARTLRKREADELRAAWRFSARYVHLLSDPALVPSPVEIVLADRKGRRIPTSSLPEAGAVWVRSVLTSAGGRVIHLIDLRFQSDDRWDAPREMPRAVAGWTLRSPAMERPVAASPWSRGGDAMPLSRDRGSGQPNAGWRLPAFRRWLVVVDQSVATSSSPPSGTRQAAAALTSLGVRWRHLMVLPRRAPPGGASGPRSTEVDTMTGDGPGRAGWRPLAPTLLLGAALAACAPGAGVASPSGAASSAAPSGAAGSAAASGAGGAVLNCGGRATTIYGWEGTVNWSYEVDRTGMSPNYSPQQQQAVFVRQSAELTILADDVELYLGPQGSPAGGNWFASRMTGSVSVDDQSICASCDEGPVEDDFYAQGSGPPLTEGADGRAGRDPSYSNFVLTVLFDTCTYSFLANAFVDGVNSQHPTDRYVDAGGPWLAGGPSPNVRLITEADLTLTGSGSFPAAYDGYPAEEPNEDLLSLGGLSGDVEFHGLGTSGDSSGTVSWSLTPIVMPQ